MWQRASLNNQTVNSYRDKGVTENIKQTDGGTRTRTRTSLFSPVFFCGVMVRSKEKNSLNWMLKGPVVWLSRRQLQRSAESIWTPSSFCFFLHLCSCCWPDQAAADLHIKTLLIWCFYICPDLWTFHQFTDFIYHVLADFLSGCKTNEVTWSEPERPSL